MSVSAYVFVCVYMCVLVCECVSAHTSTQGREDPCKDPGPNQGSFSSSFGPHFSFSLSHFSPFWLAPSSPSPSSSFSPSFPPSFVFLPFSLPSAPLHPYHFSPGCLSSLSIPCSVSSCWFTSVFPFSSRSTAPRSVQILKSLHVDKIIKYFIESLLSSFPELLDAEPRTSHNDDPPPGRQEWVHLGQAGLP